MKIGNVLTGAMLGLGAAAADACNDAQGPKQHDATVATVHVLGTPAFSVGQAIDGYPVANCTVSLVAQLSGPKSVAWGDATFYWYIGLDRTKLQDSAVVPAADVQASWDTTGASSTGEEKGGWIISDGLPFDIEMVFRYSGASSTTVQVTRTSRVTCGPAVPQGSVAPPSISQVALVQERAQWQPSDTMWVQFQASSGTGLWLTYAAFSDAFAADSVYNEALQSSAAHVVHTQIPATATLGSHAVATVFALDPFGQLVSRSVQTSPLVDITRPAVQLFMWPPPYFPMTSTIGGTYFVGDSIQFMPQASDNHGLNALVWHAAPGTYGDSILANGAVGAGGSRLFVPVRSDWANNVQFQFYAIDLVGNVSDTLTTPAHAFRIYPTLTRPTVSAAVSGDVDGEVVDTARSAVYVLQGNQHRIAIFSLGTLQQTGTVPLPGYPQAFDMTPGGDSLIVSLYQGKLAVIDLRNPAAAPTIVPLSAVDTLGGQRSAGVKVAANDRAFVLREGATAADHVLLELDLASGAQRIRSDAGVVTGITRSLDQRVLTVAGDRCVERYDVATDAFGPCTVMYPIPALPSADRTGQHFAIQLTVFDASLAPIGTVQSPWDFGGSWLPIAMSADGAYLFYYYGSTGLIRARVSDGAIMERTAVPSFFATGFQMSMLPDGTKMLFAWDDGTTGTGHLATIDLRDAVAQPLMAARLPWLTPMQRSPVHPAAVVSPPSSSRLVQPSPWRAPPPRPKPWPTAVTGARLDRGRS